MLLVTVQILPTVLKLDLYSPTACVIISLHKSLKYQYSNSQNS